MSYLRVNNNSEISYILIPLLLQYILGKDNEGKTPAEFRSKLWIDHELNLQLTPETFIRAKKHNNNSFPIIDTHTHFFPPLLMKAVWDFFEHHYWPINRKGTIDDLANFLTSECKVVKHVVLNYAHKKGLASWLNKWTHKFCSDDERKGKTVPFGTIHPDDEKKSDEMDLIFSSYEFKGLKLQLMVTDFQIWDKRMKPVYQKIMDYDRILLPHIGTGPRHSNYNPGKTISCPFVGVKHLKRFLASYPEMKIIVPHMGTDEYEEMWRLIDEYPNLYFDTAMIGVKNNPAFNDGLTLISNERLYSLADRLLFGSDFPNIPYKYDDAIKGWLERGMKEEFYEKLFFKNANKLFKL